MMLLQLILDHSQKWLELGWLLLSEHWLDSYGEKVWVRWDHKLFKQIFSNLVCYALVLRSDIWWICFQCFNKDLLSVVVKRIELVFVPILVVLLDDICENLHTAVLYAILTLSLLVLLEDHHRCEKWLIGTGLCSLAVWLAQAIQQQATTCRWILLPLVYSM